MATILVDIQKEKWVFQYQMNITLSYYLNINQTNKITTTKTFNQTKKITKTKTSIMYNQ